MKSQRENNPDKPKGLKFSRRTFINWGTATIAAPFVLGEIISDTTLANANESNPGALVQPDSALTGDTTTGMAFPVTQEDEVYSFWRNFSSPKNIRGMAARGNYVWVVGYTMAGRIDIRDDTFITFSTQVLPPYNQYNPDYSGAVLFKRPIDADLTGNNLWVGSSDSGLWRYDGATWAGCIPQVKGHLMSNISLIQVDPQNGDMWIGGREGLIKLAGTFDLLNYRDTGSYLPGELMLELDNNDLAKQANPGAYPNNLRVITGLVDDTKENNYLWISVEGGDFRRIKFVNSVPQPAEVFDNATSEILGGYVSHMVKDRDNVIWGSTVFGAVKIVNPTSDASQVSFAFDNVFNPNVQIKPPILIADLPLYLSGDIRSMVLDSEKRVWFLNAANKSAATGAGKGIAANLAGGRVFYKPEDNIPNYPEPSLKPDFNCGALDSEGNLWFGSAVGVSKFVYETKSFEPLIEIFNSGQRSDKVNAVAIGKDELKGGNPWERMKWFATERGLYSYFGLGWARYADGNITAVAVDNDNTKWYIKENKVYRIAHGSSLSEGPLGISEAAYSLAIHNSSLLVGCDSAIYSVNGSGKEFTRATGAVTGKILAIAIHPRPAAGQPVVWFGTEVAVDQGGLYSLQNNTVSSFATTTAPVRGLALRPQNNSIWIAQDDGLYQATAFSPAKENVGILSWSSLQKMYPEGTTPAIIPAVGIDNKGRTWFGIDGVGLGLFEFPGMTIAGMLPKILRASSGDGLVYPYVSGIAFEPNPYNTNPAPGEVVEDIFWFATEHGISQFAVASRATRYEPNTHDRFFGFPLKTPGLDEPYTNKINARMERNYDVDWYRIKIRQRYTRISIKLTVPDGADYDLVLYPPGRKSSGSSGIFGGLEDTAYYMDIPINDIAYYMDIPLEDLGTYAGLPTSDTAYYMDIPLLDGSDLRDRNTIVGISAHQGNSPEYISGFLSGPPGYYSIGIVNYRGKVIPDADYQLDIVVEPAILNQPPDFAPSLPRLFLHPGSPLNPNIKALALTHSGLFDKNYGAGSSTRVISALKKLSQKVGWTNAIEVIDLAQDSAVQSAYNEWAKSMANPAAANQVCGAIRELVIERLGRYPNLQYLVLAGSDLVIPFYRAREQVLLGAEAKYTKDKQWPFTDGHPIHEAFRLGYHLTDSFYGAVQDTVWRDYTIAIPELAVGRLVETAADIENQIGAFLTGQGDQQPIQKSLVTAYDFLIDQAEKIKAKLTNVGLASLSSLIDNIWSAGSLRNSLLAHPQLVILNGHFDHGRALTANYDITTNETERLFSAEELTDASRYNLRGTLFVSVGCHSGLNIPLPNSTDPKARDFAQILCGLGAFLIGNTGYGFGDSDEIIFSELLIKLVIDNLASGVGSIGKALMLAKQQYLTDCAPFGFTEYDIKALNISTLYGLPMAEVKVSNPVPLETLPAVKGTPAFNAAPGKSALSSTNLKSQLQEVNLPRNLWETVETEWGSYYRLPSQGGKVHARPGHPILPKIVRPIAMLDPKNMPHGVLLLEATYDSLSDFTPRITAPATELQSEFEAIVRDFLALEGWLPAPLVSVNRQQRLKPAGGNNIKNPAENIQDNLIVVPMHVRNPGLAKLYTYLKLELYESNVINKLGPQVGEVSTVRSGSRVDFTIRLVKRGQALPLPEIQRVLITYTLLNSGRWQSLDLDITKREVLDSDTEIWRGSLDGIGTKPGVFYVQVLDSQGNVTWSDNKGLFDTWLDLANVPLPHTFRAGLRPALEGGCSGQATEFYLFLQATGSELGTGINEIHYRYLDGTTWKEGSTAIRVRGAAGEAKIKAANLNGLEYWAEDTRGRLEGGGTNRHKFWFVTSASDEGPGTLREALENVEENGTIILNLPAGNRIIQVKRELPAITKNGITIDGLLKECSGEAIYELAGKGGVKSGLRIQASRVTVRGLRFKGFNDYALLLEGTETKVVRGCKIERNVIDDAANPGVSKVGIGLLGNCVANRITNNLLKGCQKTGLVLSGLKVVKNIIRANIIGPNGDGPKAGGQAVGILITEGASYNQIGGVHRKKESNLIIDNNGVGIQLEGTATQGNRISGNRVEQSGSEPPKGNHGMGLIISQASHHNQVEANSFKNNNEAIHIKENANDNQVVGNIFEANGYLAIQVATQASDSSSRNRLQGNSFKATENMIILGRNGNNEIKPPVITSATINNSLLEVVGTTVPTATVELYLVKRINPDQADFSSVGTVQADAKGIFKGVVLAQAGNGLSPNKGLLVVAIATSPEGNSSAPGNSVIAN